MADRYTEVGKLLSERQDLVRALPAMERQIAHMAALGANPWEIASDLGISQEAVRSVLDRLTAQLKGQPHSRVETGGLGADTDPGVTGGYGDAGFGAIDTEPPADNTEPSG